MDGVRVVVVGIVVKRGDGHGGEWAKERVEAVVKGGGVAVPSHRPR